MGGERPGALPRVVLAQLVSYLGDGMRAAALPLVALTVTQDPRLIAGVTVAAGLPTWLALAAGVWVDRTPPKTAFVSSSLVAAAAVVTIALAVAFGRPHLVLVYAVSFLLSACEIVSTAASQRWLTGEVGRERRGRANSLLVAAQVGAEELVGPILGAVLVAVSVASVFVLDTVSFVVAAALYVSLPRKATERGERPRSSVRSSLDEAVEGLRFVRGQPLLWRLTTSVVALVAAQTVLVSLLALYVTHSGFVRGNALGYVLVAGAVGGLAASVTAGPVRRRLGLVGALRLAISTVVASLLLLAAARSLVVALSAAALNGLGSAWWSVGSATARQAMTPEALAGRVSTVHRFVGRSVYPIAAMAGGVAAKAVGVRGALVLAGGAALTAHAGLVRVPVAQGPLAPGPGADRGGPPD